MTSQPHSSAKRTVKILGITAAIAILLIAGAYAAWKIRKSMMIQNALVAGNAAYEEEDWESARKMLGRYLSAHPDDEEILLKYAEAQLSVYPLTQANIAQAINSYRRLLRLDPKHEVAFKRLVLLYEKTGDYTELSQVATNRLAAMPEDPAAIIAQAKSLFSRQKPAESRDILKTLVEKSDQQAVEGPEYVEACILLCNLTVRVSGSALDPKMVDEAVSWLNRAIEHNPQSALAYVQRASIQRELARRAAAHVDDGALKADLMKAESLASSDPRVVLLLCDEWMEQSEYDRAAAQLAIADRMDAKVVHDHFIDPDDWVLAQFVESAKLSLMNGTDDHGVNLARETLKKLTDRPQYVQALPLAVELFAAGKEIQEAREAVAAFSEATRTMQANAQLQEQTALLQAFVAGAEEQPFRVIELLEPVADRPGVNPTVRTLLADAYKRTGQAGRVTKLLTQAANERTLTSSSAKILARALIQRGAWDQALDALKSSAGVLEVDIDVEVLMLTAQLGRITQEAAPDQNAINELAEKLKALKTEHPERVDIRNLLAMISQQLGNPEEAVKELRQAAEQCSDPLPAMMTLARMYTKDKRFDEARDLLQDACEKCGTQATPWLLFSDFLVNRQQIDDARATLRQGLETITAPEENRRIAIALASIDITHGDPETGIKALHELAHSDPSDVRIRTIILELPQMMHDKTQAQSLVDEIRKIEGERGLTWRLYQARLWLAGEDWITHREEIETCLRYCIDANPTWTSPILVLGRVYERLNDRANAEGVYTSGFRSTNDLDVADRLLSLYLRQKRISEARDLLERLKRVLDENAMETWRLALAVGAGQYQNAIGTLEMRIAESDSDPLDLVRLAELNYMQNKTADRSMEYLDQAAARGADPATVARIRIGILHAEKRDADAETVLDQLVAAAPTSDAYLLRALYHMNVDRTELAEQDYKELARVAKDPFGVAALGEFYAQTQRLDQAIDTWRAGLDLYPDSIMLKRGLTKALLVRKQPGDHEAAQTLIAEIQASRPDDAEVLWMTAIEKANAGTTEGINEARQLLKEAIPVPSASPDTWRGMARLAAQLGDPGTARELAFRGLKAYPGDLELQLIQARADFTLGNFDSARKLSKSILKNEPANLAAHDLLIELAFKQQDVETGEDAVLALRQLLQRNPDDESLHLLLAKACARAGKLDQAVTGLREYLDTDSGRQSVSAHLTLSDVLRLKGDFQAAQEAFDATAALSPEYPSLWRARLSLLGDQQKYDEIKALMQSNATETAPAEAFYLAASILSKSPAHLDAAVAFNRRAIELAPHDYDSYMLLGNLTYQQGDFDASIQAFRSAVEANPYQSEALNNLAWILAERKAEFAEAETYGKKAVDLNPKDPNYRDTLGFILKGLGKLDEARTHYGYSVELTPRDSAVHAQALFHLSQVCFALDDLSQIPTRLKEALAIDSTTPVFTPEERAEIDRMLRATENAGQVSAVAPK